MHFEGRGKSRRKTANNFNKSTIEKFVDAEELNIFLPFKCEIFISRVICLSSGLSLPWHHFHSFRYLAMLNSKYTISCHSFLTILKPVP